MRRLAKIKKDELETLRKEKARTPRAGAATSQAIVGDNSHDTILFERHGSQEQKAAGAIGASTWFPTTIVQLVDEEPRDWKPPPKIYLSCFGVRGVRQAELVVREDDASGRRRDDGNLL
ncbi:unnamed protein product [Linum tenue]|uniref:Uncharacterized protein n=1 Tax=Linum tenue TaxID=586396 RepID=A0AAV0H6T3_9ROSI|nr:unnamed protein product [Linum tenue]